MSRIARPVAISLMPEDADMLDTLVLAAGPGANRSTVVRGLIHANYKANQRRLLRVATPRRKAPLHQGNP